MSENKVKPGIYVSINTNWLSLKNKQLEAFNDIKYQFKNTMFSMGRDPIYGYLTGYSSDKSISYNCYIHLQDKKFYLQLGDGLFHQILDIPNPPLEQNINYFK